MLSGLPSAESFLEFLEALPERALAGCPPIQRLIFAFAVGCILRVNRCLGPLESMEMQGKDPG
jgi:hypothetical protein